jgi:hypothetical protein
MIRQYILKMWRATPHWEIPKVEQSAKYLNRKKGNVFLGQTLNPVIR